MLKAIIQKGAIVPLEPLPPNWGEGLKVSVEPRDDAEPTPEEVDQIYADLDRMCAAGDPADFERFQAALEQIARHDKATLHRSAERLE
jgi:hypothetical protein